MKLHKKLFVFKGGACPKRHILVGGDFGALPPEYLLFEDHEKCLDSYQNQGANYQEKCLPITKPVDCPLTTWQKIRESFDGIGCPKITKKDNTPEGLLGQPAPEYLSVVNYESCLQNYQASQSHSEYCLPLGKPSSCPQEAFIKLQEVFVGITCPPVKISILGGGGSQTLPPSWLNIPGNREHKI